MFLFFHSEQSDTNQSFYKGKLFEKALENLFVKLGYTITLRNKKNSLEYDIEGKNVTTDQLIIGEAKAHETTIAGRDLSAFVGKLIPLGLVEKKVHGIFLSTSSLSPEAEDYYSKLGNLDLKRYTGRKLYELMSEKLNLPNLASLEAKLKPNYTVVTDYLLITDSGYFKLIICRSKGNASPNCFAVFDEKGDQLTELNFLIKITSQITELESFEAIVPKNVNALNISMGRIIESGIKLSSDWTDYKLPAAPKFFIGRQSTIESIDNSLFKNGESFVQIKSRSGVGKSSLLAFLADKYSKKGFKIELHDSRDIKSTLDIFLLVQRFTESSQLAKDFKDVFEQIKSYANKVETKSFFLIDQFESTFSRKEIFEAYESLFNVFQNFQNKIIIIIARKNDQLTTFDESLISLEKLNQFSTSITLKDFDKDEAVELINMIAETLENSIDKEVLSYVLEFSQGFPWLIKRTMAHILRHLEQGLSQQDLVATGLKLDDLFNEELEGLDEIQFEYLHQIVQYLPANYNQLHKSFDEDPLLTQILDHLTKLRLIRLSGSTYDTYNDVLKEYILYKKLPQFKQKYLYRMAANPVLIGFHKISSLGNFDISKVVETLDVTQGTAFNFVREWKSIGVIDTFNNGWKITQIVVDVLKQGLFGDFLRRELAKNDAVSKILNFLTQEKRISQADIEQILINEFPFLEISDATWTFYSKFLISWMLALQLIEEDSTDIFKVPEKSRNDIIRDLGNLTKIRGRRYQRETFVPNTRFSVSEDFVRKYTQFGAKPFEGKLLEKDEKKAYSDLKLGGWIEDSTLTITSLEEFYEEAKTVLEHGHSDLWAVANSNGEILACIKQKYPDSTETTQLYLTKVLLSWGKGLGIIEDKRYNYSTVKKTRKSKKLLKTKKAVSKKTKRKK